MAESPSWDDDWTVGVRVWVERAGRAIVGDGRLELLEAIERWHSISEAARRVGMSYRHAWLLIQDMNEAAREPLVSAATGGKRGGGAALTARGHWVVAAFRDLRDQVRSKAAAIVPRLAENRGQPSLHLAAAVSLEEVLEELLADYAVWEPQLSVRTIFGASDELADNILAGAPADVFVTADAAQIDRLTQAHLVPRGQAVVLAENRLAALAAKTVRTDIHKPADLLKAQAGRIALAVPTCPLGGYTRTYLQALQLYDEILPRAVQLNNSRSVLAAVRAGRAEVGMVYASDAGRAADCRVLFRAGRGAPPIRYAACVVRQTQRPKAGMRLVQFLTSPEARRRFRRCGFRVRP